MSKAEMQKGFTLVEALVAMVILSIAATVLLSVFSAGARQSSSRSVRYQMHRITQSELILLYADVLAGGGEFDREIVRGSFSVRERSRLVATIPDPADQSNLFELSVTATEPGVTIRRAVTITGFVRTGGAR